VVRKVVLKLIEVGIIYPIVVHDENDLVEQQTITDYRMCIDSTKLNKSTRQDHYPFPFIY
jgi:hypothetical protein